MTDNFMTVLCWAILVILIFLAVIFFIPSLGHSVKIIERIHKYFESKGYIASDASEI